MMLFIRKIVRFIFSRSKQIWLELSAPADAIIEVGARRQARFLAVLSLLEMLLLILQALIAKTTGYATRATILVPLFLWVGLIYGFSRSPFPQWGAVLFVYGFTASAFIMSSRETADFATTLYGMIPIIYLFAGALLSVGWQIALVAVVFAGCLGLRTWQPTFVANAIKMTGNLTALGVVLVVTSMLRNNIEKRRLQALEQETTERLSIEKELRYSEERFAKIFRSSPDMCVISQLADAKIVDVNASFTQAVGYSWKDCVGKTSLDLNLYVNTEDHAVMLRRLTEQGDIYNFEVQLRRKNGSVFIANASISPITLDAQPCLIWMARDVTRLKQAEAEILELNATLERRVAERTAQLEAVNKDLEAFSYSVSHDLRAPLRNINGFAKILIDDFSTELGPMAQGFLRKIAAAGNKMTSLIDKLLDFSRLGRKPLQKQLVDINGIVRVAIESFITETSGRQIEWVLADMPPINADPILLQQVYANLVGNAVKYSRHRNPARIEVGYFEKNGEVVYFVQDNGAGFDMQYADKLFDVFQRLHSENEFEGTGIGLATVQRIIQRHGGRIWAEAQPDQGATFHFTLE